MNKKIIKFESTWCPVCKMLDPILKELVKEGVRIEVYDIEKNEDMVKEYSIETLPTLIIVSNKKEIKRHTGSISLNGLRKLIE